MLLYLIAGAAVLLALVLAARWFATVPTGDLAQAVRTFLAVFSALASTGLIFAGRFGLALITVAATVMAVRSFLRARGGAEPMGDAARGASSVRTRYLEMSLDRARGTLDGRVLEGRHAGRRLADMSIAELRALLAELVRDDPQSVALLEAYLDRRDPAWRRTAAGGGSGGTADSGQMDEATAYAILGLQPGADEAAIRAAHRRLMARLHPDHGGSNFLAAQLNRAKDVLLARRSRGRS